MNTSKYLLVYARKAKKYVLVKSNMTEIIAQTADVIWTFDSNKLSVAKKLLKNMNLASKMGDQAMTYSMS
ncbi:MAG: hypothetical protein AAGA66_14465 [Bacteroidota bacterium]